MLHDPMTVAECHRARGLSLLDGDGCRCFQVGAFLECPPATRKRIAKGRAVAAPSGDFCHDCGSVNVTRAGTCLLCRDCGSTSGGCS